MSEPDDETTAIEIQVATTLTTRKFGLSQLAQAQELIVKHGDTILPPELAEFARTYGPRGGGRPLWLVQAIGALWFRRQLEPKLTEVSPAAVEPQIESPVEPIDSPIPKKRPKKKPGTR